MAISSRARCAAHTSSTVFESAMRSAAYTHQVCTYATRGILPKHVAAQAEF